MNEYETTANHNLTRHRGGELILEEWKLELNEKWDDTTYKAEAEVGIRQTI